MKSNLFCAALLGGALLLPLARPGFSQAHNHDHNHGAPTVLAQATTGQTPLAPIPGSPSTTSTGQVIPLAPMDHLFMTRAAEGNLAEITLAQVAMRRAKAPSVKALAQHIMTEHSVAQTELLALMRSKGLTMMPMLGVTHQAVSQTLGKAKGDNFDRMYIAQQVEDHENTVALFQTQLTAGADPEALGYARRYLPGIIGHTVHLYTVAREVKAPGIEMRPAMPPTPPGITPEVKPLPAPTER